MTNINICAVFVVKPGCIGPMLETMLKIFIFPECSAILVHSALPHSSLKLHQLTTKRSSIRIWNSDNCPLVFLDVFFYYDFLFSNISSFLGPDLDVFILRREGEIRKYVCSICSSFSHKSRSNVRNHIESIHYPGSCLYSCQICGTVVNTKRALEVHRSAHHKN